MVVRRETRSSVAALFDPTWLQVFPGVDIDMPLFVEYGVYGNTASLGNFGGAGRS